MDKDNKNTEVDNTDKKLHISDVSSRFIYDEELKKKAIEFYEYWYDKHDNSEVAQLERDAVIHGFIGGYKTATK